MNEKSNIEIKIKSNEVREDNKCTNVEICDSKTLSEMLKELNIASNVSDNSDKSSVHSQHSDVTNTEAINENNCSQMSKDVIKSAHIGRSGDENVNTITARIDTRNKTSNRSNDKTLKQSKSYSKSNKLLIN
jgi:hypothetical protein